MSSRVSGETPTAELKVKIEGDLDKQWVRGGMGAGEDKMDTEGNSQERKLGIWKEKGLCGVRAGRG